VGTFTLGELAPSRWRVRLLLNDVLAVEPAQRESEVDGPEIGFEILDGETSCDLELRAVDDATGSAIAAFRASLDAVAEGRSFEFHANAADGVIQLTGALPGTMFRYRATADGYQPVHGEGRFDESTAAPRDPPTHSAVPKPGEIVVRMRAGWGTVLRVVDPDGNRLAGARAMLDGEEAGVTGADGEVALAADREPQRLQIEYRDWKRVSDSLIAEDGRFRSFAPFLTATMRPPP
jgi:hypothetical protein